MTTNPDPEEFGEQLLEGKFDAHLKLIYESEEFYYTKEQLLTLIEDLKLQGFTTYYIQNEYGGYWAYYASNNTIQVPEDTFSQVTIENIKNQLNL